MMYAWGKAGVSLSHSSKAQTGEGRPVSKSDLMPGDLIFYYSPVSHVAMYLGNGRIVHAPRPGKSVEIAPMDEMPFNSAVRPG
jgi:peptidoglycan DL-endopeptidase CwlO